MSTILIRILCWPRVMQRVAVFVLFTSQKKVACTICRRWAYYGHFILIAVRANKHYRAMWIALLSRQFLACVLWYISNNNFFFFWDWGFVCLSSSNPKESIWNGVQFSLDASNINETLTEFPKRQNDYNCIIIFATLINKGTWDWWTEWGGTEAIL